MDFVDVGRFVKLETAPIMQGSGVSSCACGKCGGRLDIPDGPSNETAIVHELSSTSWDLG